MTDINFFAKTNFRNLDTPFGIKTDDRRRHMYVIGKSGMGKTTLQENMVVQDIRNGHGVCFIDPHGDSVMKVLDYIPSSRINDVIYFDPSDLENPIAFNILETDPNNPKKFLISDGLMKVFEKIWANMWSSRMTYILNNTIKALMDTPGQTLLGVMRMYLDKKFRKKIVDNCQNIDVKNFWLYEYANWNEKYRTEAIAPIQNKIGQFLSSTLIRNIVGQPKSTFDLRTVMDNKKILLLDLSKGKIGEENSALLGAMFITKLQLAAQSRIDTPEEQRKDFYLYVDEFQNFATESFATILSEARKFRLCLTIGHQYIKQLIFQNNTAVRDAVFGNVGTMVVFRVGSEDAEFLETEFDPIFTATDILNLPRANIILKLMIDGVASQPFSAMTLQLKKEWVTGNAEKVIKVSRERYSNPAKDVNEKILRWMNPEFYVQQALLTDPSAPHNGDLSPGLISGLDDEDDTTPPPSKPFPKREFIDRRTPSRAPSSGFRTYTKPASNYPSPQRTQYPPRTEPARPQKPVEVENDVGVVTTFAPLPKPEKSVPREWTKPKIGNSQDPRPTKPRQDFTKVKKDKPAPESSTQKKKNEHSIWDTVITPPTDDKL
jgi:hypothetical protein